MSTNKKIEDNDSFSNMKREIEGFEMLQQLANLGIFSDIKDFGELTEQVQQIKQQLELHAKSPDKFNTFFSDRGWIAHESMNMDLMLKAIELAKAGNIEEAEQSLVEYYSSDKIKWLLGTLRGIEAFNIRYSFFQAAFEDTLAQRYHAVAPVLLIMMDGAVNDIDKNKGFFAEGIDLTAWDSIAAHSTGLAALKDAFNDGRKKTTQEEIHTPYRNGILHGRDLGYANRTLTAKCWAAVFAINDWANAIKKGKKNPPPEKQPLTFKEELEELQEIMQNYSEVQERGKLVNKMVEEWKPRNLVPGKDIPTSGESTSYADLSPEQEAIRFFEYWTKNNFGSMGKQINRWSHEQISEKQEAGRLRKIFDSKKLLRYAITEVKDMSPAISEVTFQVIIEHDNKHCQKQITLRLIYQNQKGDPLVFGEVGGTWKYIPSFFSEIEYI